MSTRVEVDIHLKGDASKLSAALKGAGREFLSFRNTLKAGFGLNIGAQLANGLLSIPGRFKAGIDSAVTFASQIQDLSRAANLSTEAFQVLARQAKQTGAEMGDVTKAIVGIGEKARDALGGDGKAANAFARLGIDAQAFIQLAPERQMEALGAAYASAEDKGAAFSALMELMGAKQAPKLRAMLEDLGTQGLGKLSTQMAEAGLLMRDSVGKELDEMGDKSEDLGVAFKNAWGDVAKTLKPVFDILHKLGMFVANVMANVARSLEKIAIAAGAVGAMVSDLFSGDFKGLAFYDAEAKRLSGEVDARKTAPLVGTQASPTDTSELQARGSVKDDIKDIADRVERAQRTAAADLSQISRDFTRTEDDKRRVARSILESQLNTVVAAQDELDALIEKLARADPRFAAFAQSHGGRIPFDKLAELGKGPNANKGIADAFALSERLATTEAGIQDDALSRDADPKTVAQGFQAGIVDVQNTWGGFAREMRASIADIGDAFTGSIGGAMNQLLGTTELWSQRLGNIAGPIMGAITQSISKMFAEWIAGRVAASIKDIALSAKEAAAGAPGAMMASVKSFGIAAALGIAGFLAATALTGGFFQGGFTGLGDPHDPAGIVHKGEFVIPHDVTASIGPSALAGMVEAVRNPSSVAMSSPAFTAADGSDSFEAIPQVLLIDYREQEMIERVLANPRFKTKVRHIGRQNPGDFGSPT